VLEISVAIAPIFLLIMLGHVLRRGNIPSLEFWGLNDRLVYWVLLPSLLFQKISTNEVSMELVNSYAIIVVGTFAAVLMVALLAAWASRAAPPVATSILQGSVRHNMFIALATAQALYGAQGLALATLITGLLIPVTNIAVVSSMVIMLRKGQGGGLAFAIVKDLGRNPLLLAIAAGATVNALTDTPLPIINETTMLLGNAALPVMLLCVGANIRVRELETAMIPMVIACLVKLVLFPIIIFALARFMGLSEVETSVALLFGAVPTSASSYTLARQMGGDAPLMAAIVTLQTILVFMTMPLTITLAQRFM